jgi:hypothetical protein
MSFSSSCPGLSRASTYFVAARLKDMDGRDKPGHDEVYLAPAAPDQDHPDHRTAADHRRHRGLDLQSQYDMAVIERENGADISRRVRSADAA